MHSSTIIRDLSIFVVAAAVVIFFIVRLVRKGLSAKYERVPTAKRAKSPWNALSDGEDPTA
jgi:hypothetical protein